jgi:hypothetical protein
MAYATTSDVTSRLGRALTTSETTQVEEWLTDAGLLIDGYTRAPVVAPDTVPDAYLVVSALMAIRALGAVELIPGTESSTNQVGPFASTLRFGGGGTSGGVWLSGTDKIMLRPYRVGMASLQLVSERYDVTES